jgi:hypothetical protein
MPISDPGGGGTTDPPLPPVIAGALRVEGNPAVGKTVDVVASLTILVKDVDYPVTSTSWSIVSKPAGSGATLGSSSGSDRRSLALDRAGEYRVRVTACPSGCTAGGKHLAAKSFETVVRAVSHAPPEFRPNVPTFAGRETSPSKFPDAGTMCQGGGGAVDPQWVTASYFHGPADYKMLEGTVGGSHVAGSDNFLNHDSQDWNLDVHPDAPFRNLLNADANAEEIEVEWETNHLPEAMRPSLGDRVSMFGYQILDCGHGEAGEEEEGESEESYRTEIHPPVLFAVHRAASFAVPSDVKLDLDRDGAANESVGSNVYVAGVVSDVWANANAGEILDDSSATGLHQPSTSGWTSGDKISGPSNLRRSYTFNVYLPKSPQVVAKEWGKTDAKPAPLYFGVKRHPDAPSDAVMGPMPTFVPVTEGDVTYLRVTLDLTGFSGQKLAQQIEAGWLYAAPDNFGLETYRVSVPKIDVKDSLDLVWGDWNFWLGHNGTSHPWTKIFSCHGCITDDTTYTAGTSPWQNMPSSGQLAEMKLLPGQLPRLFATGYEADNFVDDGIAQLAMWLPKTTTSGSISTDQYTAYYGVSRLGSVNASLSSAASALYADYTLGDSVVVPPALEAYPAYAATLPARKAASGLRLLGGIPLATAQASVAKASPTQIDAVLVRLRTKVDARLVANPAARTRIVAALQEASAAYPTDAWNLHLGDLYTKP